MDLSNIVGILIGLLIGVVLLLVIWAIVVRRRSKAIEESETDPVSLGAVSDAKIEEGEQASSLVSEQIEEMVKQRLAVYPDLADIKLDFATAFDESLEIRVNDQRYATVDDIPDERIRTAVEEAARTFNR